MLRWGTSTPVATSTSSLVDDSASGPFNLDKQQQQQQHDETSSSSPEPLEPTSALLPDEDDDDESDNEEEDDEDDEDGDDEDGGEVLRDSKKKNRGDKRKRSRDEDSGGGGDHVEPDDDDDEADSEDLHPVWHPQNVQSTIEFTHIISDYANKRESGCKKAEYSDISVDDHGNRWRLIIYVNGNGRASNHHLSLFLQVADADDLPFGWKKSVSYVLTLEHPNGSTFSYAKRNPDKTFKLCPKAIDWGWSQFITSDRIQQEGFVSEDALRVRASVTVKSSSINIDEEDAELYLKCAVEEGDADAVELCLEHGASVNCQFKDDLYTPLHTACSSGSSTGSMEVLEILLERGADCNACNKWRETPLLIAANNGHRMGVAALLKHGADPSLCSEAGWSALTFAAHKGYDDIVALLLRAGAPVNSRVSEDLSTPLHKACAGSKPGHLASVKLLLDASADVHALNKWRETPLLTAANHGQAGAVEMLLSRGADPCKCTDTGWSPLSIAAYKGHDDVVRLLLEEGAPTEEDDPTLSALLQAATKGLPDTVELLLQHGADHTVTTKKGDTALSILVEQNLIDAAVEMVTHYNASIPRCSRDRKKVQRARLLINLRMKQLEREAKDYLDDEDADEDESDHDGGGETTLAQHVANTFNSETPPRPNGNKKGKPKMTAEEKAKAAEEALLQELAQEEAEARKEEAEASKKQAKNRKKKERVRQLKMKEEKERREKEEQEARERERIKQEKEERERKLREEKLNEEKEREMKEAMKREKIQEKRKVKEKREKQQKPREEKVVKDPEPSPKRGQTPAASAEARAKPAKTKRTAVAPAAQSAAPNGAEKIATQPPPPLQREGNRRWETKGKIAAKRGTQPATENRHLRNRAQAPVETVRSAPSPSPAPMPVPSLPELPQVVPSVVTPPDREECALLDNPFLNGFRPRKAELGIELPSVVLYRKGKVEELLGRAKSVQNVLPVTAIKKIVGRWITRTHHGVDTYLDPVVPSWTNEEMGVAFFQRQFISENRHLGGGVNMEALKDAGSAFSALCRQIANDIVKFTENAYDHSGSDWTDVSLGMIFQSPTTSGSQIISWDNRFQVSIPNEIMENLHARFRQPTGRMLSAVFAASVLRETLGLVLGDTGMDLRISPRVQAALAAELEVSVELNSDPFSALPQNHFFGVLEEVDRNFGGMKPFTKDDCVALRENGGSCSVLLPFETMVASQYLGKILDLIQEANARQTPLSFVVFVSSLSLHDPSRVISCDELRLLDSRLQALEYAYQIIPMSVNGFLSLEFHAQPKAAPGDSMLLILQSEHGKQRYPLNGSTLSNVIESMGSHVFIERKTPPSPLMTEPFCTEYGISTSVASPYFLTPNSAFGGNAFSDDLRTSQFVPVPAPSTGILTSSIPFDLGRNGSNGGRRGRLFDLVDNDVDEDNSVDLVAGMLDKLDVGLFQNDVGLSGADVDIEAISLMGISSDAPGTSYGSTSANPFAS